MDEEHVKTLCKSIWEMAQNAHRDLCGEHRRYYVPRITDAMLAAARLFPTEFARTMYPPDDQRPKQPKF